MTDFNYLKSLPAHEREEILKADAMSVEDTTYTRALSEEEILFYKDQLADNSIRQSEMLEEKRNTIKAYNDRLKPIQEKISQALKATKYKAIDCKGVIYHLADHAEGFVHTVDADGNHINTRKMLPSERQLRLDVSHKKEVI